MLATFTALQQSYFVSPVAPSLVHVGATYPSTCVVVFVCASGSTGIALVEGQPYASLQEALLAAAEKAAKVVLNANVVVDELVLQPDVTLDLNGHTLSAEYVIGFKGSAIGGEGKLIVDPNKVTLDQTNGAFLPVYENGGYIFISVSLENRIALQGEKEFVFSRQR